MSESRTIQLKIHRRSCGHVVIRGAKSGDKKTGLNVNDSIESGEECAQCLRIKVQKKEKCLDPQEVCFVKKAKNENKIFIAVPRAKMQAKIEIQEEHTDDKGVRVIDRAKLLEVSLIPDRPFGKIKKSNN
jgi:hypothetical protein